LSFPFKDRTFDDPHLTQKFQAPPDNPPIQKSIFYLHIFTLLASRDTFVPTKIVLKVGFLERDHLAEKSYRTKMGQNTLCNVAKKMNVPWTKIPTSHSNGLLAFHFWPL
jgi:hypothetical protein